MTIFYNNEQVVDLINEGLKVPESGKYRVHLLAKIGSRIRLELAGKTFEETHVGEETEETSWNEAGEVELEANKIYNLSITPSDVVGKVSMAFETVSEHKLFHGFVNSFKRIFSSKV